MNIGGALTRGPLYRQDPEHQQRDYKPPQLPIRYQPRQVALPQIGLRPSAEIMAGTREGQSKVPDITAKQCEMATAKRANTRAQRAEEKRQVDAWHRDRKRATLTQRTVARIKEARRWLGAAELAAMESETFDPARINGLLGHWRTSGKIVVRRAECGSGLEYCWGAVARAELPRKPPVGRGMSTNSLTFWICAVMREDVARWYSTQEIALAIGQATTAIPTPDPSTVSNRMSALLRSNRVEKRGRVGAKHGHGSTKEYRLIPD